MRNHVLQRWEKFQGSVLLKLSLFMIKNYVVRMLTLFFSIVLVMTGAIVNISRCDTTGEINNNVSGT